MIKKRERKETERMRVAEGDVGEHEKGKGKEDICWCDVGGACVKVSHANLEITRSHHSKMR